MTNNSLIFLAALATSIFVGCQSQVAREFTLLCTQCSCDGITKWTAISAFGYGGGSGDCYRATIANSMCATRFFATPSGGASTGCWCATMCAEGDDKCGNTVDTCNPAGGGDRTIYDIPAYSNPRTVTTRRRSSLKFSTDVAAEEDEGLSFVDILIIVGSVVAVFLAALCGFVVYFVCRNRSNKTAPAELNRTVSWKGFHDELHDNSPKIQFPSHWINYTTPPATKFSHMIYVNNAFTSQFKEIIKDTYLEKATQDRRCPLPAPNTCAKTPGGCACVQPGADPGLPTRYHVRRVIRNEDSKLWARYIQKKEKIKEKRKTEAQGIRHFEPPLMTTAFARRHAEVVGSLDVEMNECLMWHGTHVRAALSIAHNGFALNLAGSSGGNMYGKGIYLAESCTKADEYAKDDETGGYYNGVFALVLCRVVMGKMYYTDKRDPEAGGHTKNGTHDSTCGDRAASADTFREFVVYDADQVYPEFLVFYSRLYRKDPPSAVPTGLLQLQMPVYWWNCHKNLASEAFAVQIGVQWSTRKLIQKLASLCSSKPVEIVEASRIEHSVLYNSYRGFKRKLTQEGPIGRFDTKVTMIIKQLAQGESVISVSNLDEELNEFWLWHGTTEEGAQKIVRDNFFLNGVENTVHGQRFGAGIYFAEDVDKSLSYASKDGNGIQYVLLCRVLCGKIHTLHDEQFVTADQEAKKRGRHSVVASPPKQPREFVALSPQQVYPEFFLKVRSVPRPSNFDPLSPQSRSSTWGPDSPKSRLSSSDWGPGSPKSRHSSQTQDLTPNSRRNKPLFA
eukprot:TRINITY_DN25974_c0_g1_i1.p1 TRINITY_DN25974_c0_g1~~TRINITY_DN25974_c0_g1_i1.p1  ORF type:complete len:789 (+),score=72.08 TRINITY_DN25974_c0_g1_i1:113-2479(+)